MSRANSVEKVLRTAIKRLEKRWGKKKWSQKGDDGQYYVCLEGAVTGGCRNPLTQQQSQALTLIRGVIAERYPEELIDAWGNSCTASIPNWQDVPERTLEEVLEVTKLALIRSETGGSDPEDSYINPDEVDDILSSAMPD